MGRQRINGIRFERDLCLMLYDVGFWAHDMAQNVAGQPADIIAVKNNMAVLIDCKDCANDRFSTERIEANQEFAMDMWEHKGNLFAYFALKLSNGDVFMLPFGQIDERRTWSEKDIRCELMSFEEWSENFGD